MNDLEQQPPQVETSVLIVSHNCAPALRRCLAALDKSKARETTEVLVVDCGSVDDSARIDTEFPAVTVLRLPRNFGRTKARNIGVRTAKGEYLFLLEPHVEVQPGTVPSLISTLASRPDAAAVCPLLVDASGSPVSETGPLPTPETLVSGWRAGASGRVPLRDPGVEPVEAEYPSPDAVFLRRLFVKGMNYFDQRYGEFGSDLELFTQVRRAGRKALILPAVHAVSHREASNAMDSAARACLSADRALGSAAWTGKHFGWLAGLRLRLRIVLVAFGLLFGLTDFFYRFGVFSRVVKGEKVDGFQKGL
ncbi:MAG: glycosyltransferase [Bryobacteraceae bacterium]